MTNYRRNSIPGGSFFFTVALADRSSRLLVEEWEGLRLVMEAVKKELPFRLEAMVVLPDHLHAIWTLPSADRDYSTRWKKIKAGFSRRFPKRERRSASRLAKGERGIWQRRFWEHTLRDEADWHRHMDYIHYAAPAHPAPAALVHPCTSNPVKHGYVTRVADWPCSTFHRCVRGGVYPVDWGGDTRGEDLSAGEPG